MTESGQFDVPATLHSLRWAGMNVLENSQISWSCSEWNRNSSDGQPLRRLSYFDSQYRFVGCVMGDVLARIWYEATIVSWK